MIFSPVRPSGAGLAGRFHHRERPEEIAEGAGETAPPHNTDSRLFSESAVSVMGVRTDETLDENRRASVVVKWPRTQKTHPVPFRHGMPVTMRYYIPRY